MGRNRYTWRERETDSYSQGEVGKQNKWVEERKRKKEKDMDREVESGGGGSEGHGERGGGRGREREETVKDRKK